MMRTPTVVPTGMPSASMSIAHRLPELNSTSVLMMPATGSKGAASPHIATIRSCGGVVTKTTDGVLVAVKDRVGPVKTLALLVSVNASILIRPPPA